MKKVAQVVLVFGLAAACMRGQTSAPSSSTPSQDTNAPASNPSNVLLPAIVNNAGAEEPFQQEVELSIGTGNVAAYGSIPVPSGKRLVIEYLSLFGNLPAGQRLNVSVVTLVSGLRASYRPQINTQDAGDGTTSVSASEVMRVYADSGTIVSLNATRSSSTGSGPLTVSISGHYVNLP